MFTSPLKFYYIEIVDISIKLLYSYRKSIARILSVKIMFIKSNI